MLTYLKDAGKNRHGQRFAECTCDCGKQVLVLKSKINRGTKSCGCLKTRIWRQRLDKIKHRYGRGFSSLFSSYKYSAKIKKIDFSLSDDDLYRLSQEKCSYCGSSPFSVSNRLGMKFVYNGIDRVDSNKGYTLENCVACCKACNYAKRTLSVNEFKSLISLICERWPDTQRSYVVINTQLEYKDFFKFEKSVWKNPRIEHKRISRFERLVPGTKIGYYEVIGNEFIRSSKSTAYYCECKCVCGKIKIVKSGHLRSGAIKSCGSCSRLGHPGYMRLAPGKSMFNSFVDSVKNGAFSRNLEYLLEKEHIFKLVKSSCYYCGRKDVQRMEYRKAFGGFSLVGIDRKDNSKGYTVENSVPCCMDCNRAKRDHSLTDFVSWANRVKLYLNL
jgi:hypothetical protein